MTVVTKQFPTADRIYAARFGVNVDGTPTDGDAMTWNEMRAHFSVSARSSRFLAEVVALVNGSDALLARHPEMAHLEVPGKDTAEWAAFVALIRNLREHGQGLAMLEARTGLTKKDLKALVGEAVGTTSRVGFRARYHGKLPKATEETTEESGATEEAAETTEDAPAPAPKPRRRRAAAKSAK